MNEQLSSCMKKSSKVLQFDYQLQDSSSYKFKRYKSSEAVFIALMNYDKDLIVIGKIIKELQFFKI